MPFGFALIAQILFGLFGNSNREVLLPVFDANFGFASSQMSFSNV